MFRFRIHANSNSSRFKARIFALNFLHFEAAVYSTEVLRKPFSPVPLPWCLSAKSSSVNNDESV